MGKQIWFLTIFKKQLMFSIWFDKIIFLEVDGRTANNTHVHTPIRKQPNDQSSKHVSKQKSKPDNPSTRQPANRQTSKHVNLVSTAVRRYTIIIYIYVYSYLLSVIYIYVYIYIYISICIDIYIYIEYNVI